MILRILILFTLLVAAGPAHADPVSGAIAAITAIKAAMAASALVTALVKIGLTVAVTVGQTLLGKAMAKKERVPGIKQDKSIGAETPLSYMLGNGASAGHFEYHGSWKSGSGTPNNMLVQVFSLADIPITALGGTVWINGEEKVTLDLTPTEDARGFPVASGKYAGLMWVRFLDGSQAAADPYLLDKFGSDPKYPITSATIWRGIALAIVTTKLKGNGGAWGGGVPEFIFETVGIPLYNPAKDSTNGGFGTHRWSDPATWEPSDNPVVQIYNLLRGIWYGDEWVHGGQTIGASRMPSGNWIAGINACDVLVTIAGGGTEKAYRSSMECFVNEEPLALVEECLAACAGRFVDSGGVYKIKVGAPGAAVWSFTDDDVVITSEQELDPFPSLDETINGVVATYPNPLEAWENMPAPSIHDAALESADQDRRLPGDVNFNAVPHVEQVQRLMAAMLADNRRFLVHSLVLPPDAWVLEPGDVIGWTSARNGYAAKTFEVKQTELLPNANIAVVIREVDADDFEEPETVAITPVDVTPDDDLVQVMTGWQVAPVGLDEVRPSIAVTFAGDSEDVAAVAVEVRDTATQTVMFTGQVPYGAVGADGSTKTIALNGVFQPLTSYQVRGRFVPVSAREADWSSWLTVVTLDLRPGLDDLAEEVSERFGEIEAGAALTVAQARTLAEGLQQVALDLTDGDTRQQIIINRVQAALPGFASAEALSLLSASVTEELEAVAESVTSLSASTADRFASGLMDFRVVAAPSGVDLRFAIILRAEIAGDELATGLFLDLWEETGVLHSRIALAADQVVFTDGTGVSAALSYDSGTSTLTVPNLVVETLNLATNSVITDDELSATKTIANNTSWQTVGEITIDNPNPSPILFDWELSQTANMTGTVIGTVEMETRLIRTDDSFVLKSVSRLRTDSGTMNASDSGFYILTDKITGPQTFAIQQRKTGTSASGISGSSSGTIRMIWWKR